MRNANLANKTKVLIVPCMLLAEAAEKERLQKNLFPIPDYFNFSGLLRRRAGQCR